MEIFNEIISLLPSLSKKDAELLHSAFAFAENTHKNQKRLSGEPYLTHVLEVAKILTHFSTDTKVIAAGLLHDVLEDSAVTKQELEQKFGSEIAFLVDGVTKLKKYTYKGVTRHAESLRKFLLAFSKDMRVLIIRFADRLHNLQTLKYVRSEKQKRIALETIEIYAPIANRLRMGQIKGELEDMSFPYILPDKYKEVKTLHKERSKDAHKRLKKVYRSLQKNLQAENVKVQNIDYRIKHLYSLYKKLLKYNDEIDKIYDIVALRLILSTVSDCYRTLGIIHGMWLPLPGRIKDYIAFPKPNGYQSLHTTVFTGNGEIVEIQIRTQKMHEEAEYGIAAHLTYKENVARMKGEKLSKKLSWIQEIVEWQKQISESKEFLEDLKMDFFKDRVFVFTPKGDVIDLPEDSCPIDFAYAIHSDIGNHTAGARVNGKLVALSTKLQNNDIIEILTKKTNSPSIKWKGFVKTALAKKHIRITLKTER